jgi:hypothetical protein
MNNHDTIELINPYVSELINKNTSCRDGHNNRGRSRWRESTRREYRVSEVDILHINSRVTSFPIHINFIGMIGRDVYSKTPHWTIRILIKSFSPACLAQR